MVFFLDLSFCNLIKGSLARTRIIEKSFVKFLTSMDFLLFNFLFLSPSIGCPKDYLSLNFIHNPGSPLPRVQEILRVKML